MAGLYILQVHLRRKPENVSASNVICNTAVPKPFEVILIPTPSHNDDVALQVTCEDDTYIDNTVDVTSPDSDQLYDNIDAVFQTKV